MRIAMAQRNPVVGDISGNAALALDAVAQAKANGAQLLMLSELFLTGYPPRDLLGRPRFIEDVVACAKALASHIQDITLLIGAPWPADERDPSQGLHNSILVIRNGRIVDRYDKQLLPSYDIFDEDRYFVPGAGPLVLDIEGIKIGLSICEDLWRGKDADTSPRYKMRIDPIEQLVRSGAQLILNSSASPYNLDKDIIQRRVLQQHCKKHNVVLAEVNQLGANDDQIYHGAAAVYMPDDAAPDGASLIAAGKPFHEDLITFEFPPTGDVAAIADPLLDMPIEAQLWAALVLGVRDYFHKTGHENAVLGLSGGIDSALTACLATAALGPEHVIGLSMPSKYSSPGSVDDARTLANTLGISMLSIPIHAMHQSASQALGQASQQACDLTGHPGVPGTADENRQSRLRGLSVMSVANSIDALALVTGNKSEMAVGYSTLYGDMSGGLAVLADVTKTRLYALSRWLNENYTHAGFAQPPIPIASIDKPPSAELKPDQTDQDSLPPYDELDAILERYVEQRLDPDTIESQTQLPRSTIEKVIQLIDRNEFKRQQAPIGLKVTRTAFGCGRRYPVAQRYIAGRVFNAPDAAQAATSPSPVRR